MDPNKLTFVAWGGEIGAEATTLDLDSIRLAQQNGHYSGDALFEHLAVLRVAHGQAYLEPVQLNIGRTGESDNWIDYTLEILGAQGQVLANAHYSIDGRA